MTVEVIDSRAAVLDAALDAIITIDVDGRIVEFNAAAERTFGFTRDEARGRLLADLIVPPRFREDHLAGIRRAAATGETRILGRRIQLSAQRADGSEFPVELAVTRVPHADPPLYTGFIRDLTEQWRIERRRAAQYRVAAILSDAESFEAVSQPLLETLLDAFQAAFGAVWTVEGDFLRCRRLAHMTSFPDDSFASICQNIALVRGVGLPGRVWESASSHWIENVQEDDNFPRAEAAAHQGLRGAFGFPIVVGGVVTAVFEFFYTDVLHRDEDFTKLLSSIAQQVAQFVARKQAEAERAHALVQEHRARVEAEAANRAKDDFIAVVSHEVRTPLNAILGWSTLLKSGALNDEKRARAIDAIDASARTQAQLIEDLLDVSRIGRGKLTLSCSWIDAAAAARTAVDMLLVSGQQRGVTIRTQGLDESVPVWADRARVQQIVLNVVSNAVKFTPRGGLVTVTLSGTEGQVRIVVQDTGIGIRPDFLPHLFERFRQGEAAATRAPGGLGLGLAIVRHLVELHGGSVKAASDGEGKGSTFVITLPIDVKDKS